jgi:hypothetical protein
MCERGGVGMNVSEGNMSYSFDFEQDPTVSSISNSIFLERSHGDIETSLCHGSSEVRQL